MDDNQTELELLENLLATDFKLLNEGTKLTVTVNKREVLHRSLCGGMTVPLFRFTG